MTPDDWLERWREGRIGFHQSTVHAALTQYYDAVLGQAQRILVPLSGKSLDVLWLGRHGHADIVAVEVAQQAVESFHRDNQLPYTIDHLDPFTVYRTGRIATYQGDFFALDSVWPGGSFDGIYDRAALIALTESARLRYAKTLVPLLAERGRMLLVALEYDSSKMDGPPFCVPRTEVERLFADTCDIEELSRQDVLGGEPRFRQRGLTALTEVVYRLNKSGRS
ncbi:MAG: thiopurine S-methyltransferase [Myxococcota bacterium]